MPGDTLIRIPSIYALPRIADEQYTQGRCLCFECWHEWIGVWPLNADDLECPQCGSTDTTREFETEGD